MKTKKKKKAPARRAPKKPATPAPAATSGANVVLGCLDISRFSPMGYSYESTARKEPSRSDLIVTVRTLAHLIHP